MTIGANYARNLTLKCRKPCGRIRTNRKGNKMIPDTCSNNDCPYPKLRQGQPIVQIAKGRCFNGHITPTYTDEVYGEWHERCYRNRKFRLKPQAMPFKCQKCGRRIEHGEEVLYAIKGSKPAPGFIRPQARGYLLWLVQHIKCPEKKDTNPPNTEVQHA